MRYLLVQYEQKTCCLLVHCSLCNRIKVLKNGLKMVKNVTRLLSDPYQNKIFSRHRNRTEPIGRSQILRVGQTLFCGNTYLRTNSDENSFLGSELKV